VEQKDAIRVSGQPMVFALHHPWRAQMTSRLLEQDDKHSTTGGQGESMNARVLHHTSQNLWMHLDLTFADDKSQCAVT